MALLAVSFLLLGALVIRKGLPVWQESDCNCSGQLHKKRDYTTALESLIKILSAKNPQTAPKYTFASSGNAVNPQKKSGGAQAQEVRHHSYRLVTQYISQLREETGVGQNNALENTWATEQLTQSSSAQKSNYIQQLWLCLLL